MCCLVCGQHRLVTHEGLCAACIAQEIARIEAACRCFTAPFDPARSVAALQAAA